MKKALAAILVMVMVLAITASTSITASAKEYTIDSKREVIGEVIRGRSSDERACRVVVDDNYMYVLGDIRFNETNVFIAKLDKNGKLIWVKMIGKPSGEEYAYSIAIDDKYIYVSGEACTYSYTYGDAYIAKLDKDGNLIWFKLLKGRSHEKIVDIAVDNNYIYIIGDTQSEGSVSEVFIAKLDKNGNMVWNRTIDGNSWDEAKSITLDSNYIYIAGLTYSYGAGDADAFIAKLDKNGNLIWFRTIGGSAYDDAADIAVDNNYIYVDGETDSFNVNNGGWFIAKLDKNGKLVWFRTISMIAFYRGGGIAVDDKYVYAVGETFIIKNVTELSEITAGYTVKNTSAYVIRMDKNGNLIWFKFFDGNDTDEAIDVVSYKNKVYVVGETKNYGTGDFDAFVIWRADKLCDCEYNICNVSDYTRNVTVTTPTIKMGSIQELVAESIKKDAPNIESVNLSPSYIHAKVRLRVTQPDITKAVMNIITESKNIMLVTANSTSITHSDYGCVLRVAKNGLKTVVYAPENITTYTIKGDTLIVELREKTVVSIAAPKNSINEIIIDYGNRTVKTICNNTIACEALRDEDGVIVVDPSKITIRYNVPSAQSSNYASNAGFSNQLGGEITRTTLCYALIIMTAIILLITMRFRRIFLNST